MKKIEYLPHIADVRLKIEADTLEELFEAGLQGMSNLLKDKICQKESKLQVKKQLKIESVDLTALLVDFLSEVLTESYVRNVLFCKFQSFELHDAQIDCTLKGQSVNSAFDDDIKAVTYHEAEVSKNNLGNWETFLIFDI